MIIIFISFLLFLCFSFFNPNNSKSNYTIFLLFFSSIFGVLSATIFLILDCPSFLFSLNWYNSGLLSFSFSFTLDYYFIIFGAVALYVTWSIVEFSHYYMSEDPNKQAFLNTLILFLFFMLLLVTSNSLFLLFIGWEGVGILSFILIGWWFTRSDANSSALQAIIYNRIGDGGMILFILLSIINNSTWELNELIFFSHSHPLTNYAIIGIIIAAAGKSAQFSLHPWLPSAMEGPTPVSALLHSSTMVVAGVFLLIRCSPLLSSSFWALSLVALLGSLTALYAASTALGQFDIKKIVAYSTTSQLGLMVVSVGLGLPWLALFHICTHAFFKALLFLCSGGLIHALNNEQDLRKMGSSASVLPFTTSALVIGSLSLCGLPFLAGFYSKDLILEAAQSSLTNSISIILSLVATLITALYSSRIIFYLSFSKPSTSPLNPINEENLNLTVPLLRLLFGVFCSGWFFSLTAFHSQPILIPLFNKSLPLFVTFLGGICILILLLSFPTNLTPTVFFLGQNWFYTHLFHGSSFFFTFFNSVKGVLRTLDYGWTSFIGPASAASYISNITKLLRPSQTGNLTNYITYFIILSFFLFSFFFVI
uniref:NADH-ubiquinone oxidoreductase chain 5 n=1 Tax=Amphiura digitula TaxID=2588555 RepID=A0A4Y5T2W5_9ECHI|nr:NADH dehydrogenase subunit 5 [Amphiura digitula]QDA81584.1 NADH dehydrogenase subunit 5 [Amphiura digitula]QHT54242.1 NADH dehydrogenase subunit 5 [Amphiura digitula]